MSKMLATEFVLRSKMSMMASSLHTAQLEYTVRRVLLNLPSIWQQDYSMVREGLLGCRPGTKGIPCRQWPRWNNFRCHILQGESLSRCWGPCSYCSTCSKGELHCSSCGGSGWCVIFILIAFCSDGMLTALQIQLVQDCTHVELQCVCAIARQVLPLQERHAPYADSHLSTVVSDDGTGANAG